MVWLRASVSVLSFLGILVMAAFVIGGCNGDSGQDAAAAVSLPTPPDQQPLRWGSSAWGQANWSKK